MADDITAAIRNTRERLGISQEVEWSEERSLADVFNRAVTEYARLPALSSLGHTISYGELDELSARFAGWVQRETDLQPGDRIAIQLPNLIQYPVVLFGALRAGLVVVNTNPLYSVREIEHQLNDSGARALVVLANVADHAATAVARSRVKHVVVTELADLHPPLKRFAINFAARYIKRMVPRFHFEHSLRLTELLATSEPHYQAPATELEDMAVLQYTGGTTGRPKGARLSHRNLIANTLQCSEMFDTYGFQRGSETMVVPLPLYHIYSFLLSMIMLRAGNHAVLVPNPRDLDSVVQAMDRYPSTAFCGLNTLFVALCNHPRFARLDFSRLKLTLSGGMALTRDAAHRWEEITGCPIYEGYGLTETSPVVSVNPGNGNQLGTIGIPVPGTEVRILDDEDREQALDTPGELCVRGPQVMQGYWNNREETAKALSEDGWFRTGDMAVVRADGYLKIVDRKKDMILVSGFNVYPSELEDVFSEHPQVRECAVVGVPDEQTGEAVVLVVVPTDSRLDGETLREWARERMTGYKVPKRVEFRDELPKSNVGKVLRRVVRDELVENRPG